MAISQSKAWAASLAALLTAAALATAPAAAQPIPAEVLEAAEIYAADCGGSPSPASLVEEARLSGSDRPDYVIDLNAVDCSYYCGSAGCTLDVFVPGDEGYRLAYSGNIFQWSGLAGEQAGLALTLHGSACGRAGFEGCEVTLFFNRGTGEFEE